MLKLPDGTIKVLVEGLTRVSVDQVVEHDGALRGCGIEIASTQEREEREIEAIVRSLLSLFEQYVKTNRKLPPELLQTLNGIDDPGRLADTIAAHLSVRLAYKQRLLETIEIGDRLEILIGLVDGEIDVQQMEKRIRGRVKSQMEKSQREYYLNEQMKAIQKELVTSTIFRVSWRSWLVKLPKSGCQNQSRVRLRANSTSLNRCLQCQLRQQ